MKVEITITNCCQNGDVGATMSLEDESIDFYLKYFESSMPPFFSRYTMKIKKYASPESWTLFGQSRRFEDFPVFFGDEANDAIRWIGENSNKIFNHFRTNTRQHK